MADEILLNDGSRILVITQRHKLGMTKPIGSRPLQEFHLNNSLGTQPNALLHLLTSQFIAPIPYSTFPAELCIEIME
ncbi:MAG: hypothetical protein WAK48_23875 [Candidatus Acidiferrum sp.]|jgi:hypothetical protein